ncbi:MAG: MATE family efflux transporter [Burkholderiales bacterium]
MNPAHGNPLLAGPIAPQLLRLAWPVLVVLALQTLVGVAETWFVSFLGTSALAGVSLVFPVFMLMAMMSNGGIGGGVSAAVARARGAGRREDADALAWHAVVLGIAFGALFTAGVFLGGPALFARMGGEGSALASAVLYANLVFLAAIPGWIANLLAAALRGAGQVRVPAIVTAVGSFVTLGLSPLLIFGAGLGVAGAGVSVIVFNVGALLALVLYMRSRSSPLRLRRSRLEARLFGDILKVGLLSAVGTIMSNLSVVVTTGLVGRYGTDAIAGYGLASRLDYLLIPLLFALGTASLTMVGTNVGAHQHERARRIAWTAALVSALAVGAIGLVAALFPQAWMHLFSRDPAVVAAGVAYLRRVAPLYVVFGAGLSLYFSSQGAGRMAWPFAAGIVRLGALVGLAAWAAGSLEALYWVVALTYLIFGGIIVFGMASGLAWGLSARRAAQAST